jgi:hypothetical protein
MASITGIANVAKNPYSKPIKTGAKTRAKIARFMTANV